MVSSERRTGQKNKGWLVFKTHLSLWMGYVFLMAAFFEKEAKPWIFGSHCQEKKKNKKEERKEKKKKETDHFSYAK